MKVNKKIIVPFLLIAVLVFGGWGQTGHKIINQNCTASFPPEMSEFLNWSATLAQHASDADNRKGSDPTEAPKHFIDIDIYPEFVANHRISQSYDSVVAKHSSAFVISNGLLPWAIIATYDTLKACFLRRDWNKAVLTAADLGHYVADSHQPLHITNNYNPGGLHSRYETGMVDKYQTQITYSAGNALYIPNIPDFVFNSIYSNYVYVDSVIRADSIAQAISGSNKSDTYYQKLWELTGNFTISLFKDASISLASIIYSAWTDAGSPLPSGGNLAPNNVHKSKISSVQTDFSLSQNYPNPFNPSTTINYSVPTKSHVSIKIYNILGVEISTLVNEIKSAGKYSISFNMQDALNSSGGQSSNINSTKTLYSSGVFFCRMQAGNFIETKKLVLLK